MVSKWWSGLDKCKPGRLRAPRIFSGITAAKRAPHLKKTVNGWPIGIQKPS
jgi:hypothetical protein